MTRERPHLTSIRDDWNTPESILSRVRAVGPIALDPCSNPHSTVRAEKELCADGLEFPWASRKGLVFVNPPYGRSLKTWVLKCAVEAQQGAEIVLLVPARPGTSWWREYVLGRGAIPLAARVCFLYGRPRFLSEGKPGTHACTFDVAVIYYGSDPARFSRAFAGAGWFASLSK